MSKIYVIEHKPVALPQEVADSKLYEPLQVGAAGKEHFAETTDDTGDNISQLNDTYNELTGLYWIWKNSTEDVVGLCHYRRFFVTPGGKLKNLIKKEQSGYITEQYIGNQLKRYDIIIHNVSLCIPSNKAQYEASHQMLDLRLTKKVIEELCPEYMDAYHAVMNGKKAHFLNMCIAKKALIDEYCQWLFPLLAEIERRLRAMDADMNRTMGMIAERLLDVWITHNNIRYKECFSINTERVDWKAW